MIKLLKQKITDTKALASRHYRSGDNAYLNAEINETSEKISELSLSACAGYRDIVVVAWLGDVVPLFVSELSLEVFKEGILNKVVLYPVKSFDEGCSYENAKSLFLDELSEELDLSAFAVYAFPSGVTDLSLGGGVIYGELNISVKAELDMPVVWEYLKEEVSSAAAKFTSDSSKESLLTLNSERTLLLSEASKGNPMACFEVARISFTGIWPLCSKKEALELFLYAAKNGIHKAYRNLGVIYKFGLNGIDSDQLKATEYLMASLSYFNSNEDDVINWAYESAYLSDKVPHGYKYEQMSIYLESQVKKGDAVACYRLGKMMIERQLDENRKSNSVKRGIKLMRIAKKAGIEGSTEFLKQVLKVERNIA